MLPVGEQHKLNILKKRNPVVRLSLSERSYNGLLVNDVCVAAGRTFRVDAERRPHEREQRRVEHDGSVAVERHVHRHQPLQSATENTR